MDVRGAYKREGKCVLVKKPEERGNLKDPGMDGYIILKRIFRKSDCERAGFIWLRIRTCGELL
jgi:hypothetical protein